MKISTRATTRAIATTCAVLLIAPAIASAGAARDLTRVNESIAAAAGESYDTLSTVNGDVRVGAAATANEAKTVNGNVTLEADARIGRVRAVNGSLDIRERAVVEHEATTVNGGVALGQKAHVGGDVTTVSGDIRLQGADVDGGLQTRNGDIELRDGARVRGGIYIKKKNDGWDWGDDHDQPVKVNICATCEVAGELRFDRAVILHVEPGAKIGQVIGDRVTRR